MPYITTLASFSLYPLFILVNCLNVKPSINSVTIYMWVSLVCISYYLRIFWWDKLINNSNSLILICISELDLILSFFIATSVSGDEILHAL